VSADLLALAVLSVAAYATRAIGFYLAGLIAGSKRIEHLLTTVSGCVIATLIAPAMVNGDAGLRVGVLVALAAFAVWRNTLPAIVAAALAAALFRMSAGG